MEAFQEIEREKFIVKSLHFLEKNFPEWCADKDENERREFINFSIDFGEKYDIRKEINLQKMMVFDIQYELLQREKEIKDILETVFQEEDNKIKTIEKHYNEILKQ